MSTDRKPGKISGRTPPELPYQKTTRNEVPAHRFRGGKINKCQQKQNRQQNNYVPYRHEVQELLHIAGML